jgi:hypothetical protein
MNIAHLREQAKRQIETGQSLFTASGWAENTVTALDEIEALRADLAAYEQVEGDDKETCVSMQREIERLRAELFRTNVLLATLASVCYKDEVQQHLPYGVFDQVVEWVKR